MMIKNSTILPQFIVSVQAEDHEPLAPLPVLLALCESVLQGGAEGLRLANLEAMRLLKEKKPEIFIVGLHKPYPLPSPAEGEVYITSSLRHALNIAATGVDMVALDATPRLRPEGETLAFIVRELKQAYPTVRVMGDIDSIASATHALACGCDVVGTTLSGYTEETKGSVPAMTPDFALLEALVAQYPHTPIVCEGRIWQPEEAHQALVLGATGVVVGSAITRPHHITARFKAAL
jgi:N-acylglucosamine-6-phosphate 2-epimerase